MADLNRYHLWAITGRDFNGKEYTGPILLVGLGTKTQCKNRWRYFALDERNQPILLWQQIKRYLPSAKATRTILYGKYATRAEAEAIMLNLRAQNRYLLVEDWTK